MLTNISKYFSSKYCRKVEHLMKQQLLIEKKKKLENELRGYVDEPSYLKRQVREIELKIKKLMMGAE